MHTDFSDRHEEPRKRLPVLVFAGDVTAASISVATTLNENYAAHPSWQFRKIEEIGPDDGWSNCRARCRISRNATDLPTAAAFIYNVYNAFMDAQFNISYLSKRKPAGQLWFVSDFFEHPSRKFASRWRLMKQYESLIDGALTFASEQSETPLACPMFTVEKRQPVPGIRQGPPLSPTGIVAEKTYLVAWVASKCYPKRMRYAERLKAKLVALFGKPAETFWRDYGSCAPGGKKISGANLTGVLAQTKFYLAFENSECTAGLKDSVGA
jgi:Glycosyltransferase family 10 (fucosyltransferase).